MRINGTKKNSIQIAKKLHTYMVQATLDTNLTAVQMTRTRKGKADNSWYDLPRRVTARVFRNIMAASPRTSAWGLILELGITPTDEGIIKAKMRLFDRIYKYEEGTYQATLRQHRSHRTHTDKKGLHYEVEQLWIEARTPHRLHNNTSEARRKEQINEAATTISNQRAMKWLAEQGRRNGQYHRLWEGKQAMHLNQGTRKQIGLMISARLGALLLKGNKTGERIEEEGERNCSCCEGGQTEDETHLIIECQCPEIRIQRKILLQALEDKWSEQQKTTYQEASNQNKCLYILGMKITPTDSEEERMNRDQAAKHYLEAVDDIRREWYQQKPLNAVAHDLNKTQMEIEVEWNQKAMEMNPDETEWERDLRQEADEAQWDQIALEEQHRSHRHGMRKH
jgi:hypothetical protein